MKTSDMIEYILQFYPGWKKGLCAMPDNQLIAIYSRLRAQAQAARIIANGMVIRDIPLLYTYHCKCCFNSFESDNPEVQECRYCGSPRQCLEILGTR